MAASMAELLPACGSACWPIVFVHMELACKAMLQPDKASVAQGKEDSGSVRRKPAGRVQYLVRTRLVLAFNFPLDIVTL